MESARLFTPSSQLSHPSWPNLTVLARHDHELYRPRTKKAGTWVPA
jgi:hypothetical protein